MKQARLSAVFGTQVIAIIALLLQSCGMVNNASPSTSCPANAVVVKVYTGSITRVCGCLEGNNASFGFGQAFTCTVARGTTVLFNYPSISSQHLISITGAANNGTLGYHAPGSESTNNPSDSIVLQSTGTVNFYDTYQPQNVFGTFTVQ